MSAEPACVRCVWWEGDERHVENQYPAACVATRTLMHGDDACERFTDAAAATRRLALLRKVAA